MAMGEMRWERVRRRAQQLGERVKRLGDDAKRWMWRDAGRVWARDRTGVRQTLRLSVCLSLP